MAFFWGAVAVITLGLLIYLIQRRFKIKREETFEKRKN